MTLRQVEIAEALNRLAPRLRQGGTGSGDPVRLSAGATLETWAFEVRWPGGVDRFILRRAPSERIEGALPLDVEAGIVAVAAASGVPVANPVLILDPADGLGEGFVMPRIEGETLPQRILRDAQLSSTRAKLPEQLAEVAAAIHRVSTEHLEGLKSMDGRERVQQLSSQLRALDHPRPVFELALRWLEDNLPPPRDESVLVHGDYRLGNLVVGPDGLRAVLDWELAHLGDPLEDLAWFCLPPWRFGVMDKAAGGLGSAETFLAAYEAASGRLVDQEVMRFWSVAGSLRWGLGCAEMSQWVSGGRDASIERAMIARRASESEIDLLRVLMPREQLNDG